MQLDPSKVQPDPNNMQVEADGAENLETIPQKAPLDPKKKILLLSLLVVVLLGGVGAVLYSMGMIGGTDATTTSNPPPPVNTNPQPPGGPAVGGPGSMPVTPTQPGAPGTATTGVRSNPTASASAMPPVTMNQAALSAITPEPVYTDPFSGWQRIKPPPPPKKNQGKGVYTPVDNSIPVVDMPGVLSTPGSSDTGGGGAPAGGGDDDGGGGDFFGAVPTHNAAAGLGRNVGWISQVNNGVVTAYFQTDTGKYIRVGVGAMIDGCRVKAISTEYMLLVDVQTGREERVRLNGSQRVSNAAPAGS